MKLLTKEIEKQLEKHPIGSQEGRMMDARVIVKYFNPYGPGTWLITEGERQEDGDWMLFGYAKIHEKEWGYVMLSELQSIHPILNLGIERDLYIGNDATVGSLCQNM